MSGSRPRNGSVVAVLDGHNDAIKRDDHAQLATGRATGHVDLPRMRQGGVRAAFFAICTSSPDGQPQEPVPRDDGVHELPLAQQVDHAVACEFTARAASRLLALERSGDLRIARSVADLDDARDGAGPPAAIMALEGAEAIDPGVESLELWHAAGVRSIGPVWSRRSSFGDGVPFMHPSSPDTGPGLTDAGQRLIRSCAELGIMVDLAHLNEAGFWDVARAEVGPLVSTHTAAHALCQHSRNFTDRQLDAVGDSGGLVGIVYSVPFLRADFSGDPDTPLTEIARHAVYVAERIGVEHVALGSDFDGAIIPAPLGDVAGVPRVLDALAAAGFNDDELAAIAWDNWRRVLAAWWH